MNLEALQDQKEQEEQHRREFEKRLAKRKKPRGPYRKRTQEELEEKRAARSRDPTKRRFMARRFIDDEKKKLAELERDKEISKKYEELQNLRSEIERIRGADRDGRNGRDFWRDIAGDLVARLPIKQGLLPLGEVCSVCRALPNGRHGGAAGYQAYHDGGAASAE